MITPQDPFFASAHEGKSFHVVTDTLTVKVPSERVNGAYSVTEDVTPPGGGAPPHLHHREDEMFYVLEGEYEFRCGDHVTRQLRIPWWLFRERYHVPSRIREML